jgi:hypothetical protein
MSENSRNLLRLDNLLTLTLPKREAEAKAVLEHLENDLSQAQNRAAQRFDRDGELAELTERLSELDKILSEVTAQSDVAESGEEIVETPEEKAEREAIFSRELDPSDVQIVPADDDSETPNQGKGGRK